MEILQRILQELEKKSIKQKDFCEATGISEKTLSTWKARDTNPPADKISSIADYLGLTTEEILTGFSSSRSGMLLPEEEELLENYRRLDSRGRHKMHALAYDELDRMEAECRERNAVMAAENTG